MRHTLRFTKLLSVFSIIFSLIFLLNGGTAQAAEIQPARGYTSVQAEGVADSDVEYYQTYESLLRNAYVRTASSSLTISGSTATCTGYGSKYATASGNISISVYLQKKVNGVWTTYSSGSGTYTGTYGTKTLVSAISRGTYSNLTTVTVNGEKISVRSESKTY